MAEITKTEISVVEDTVAKVENGTGLRRFAVFIRGTTASITDTLNIASYISNVTGIMGPRMEVINGVSINTSGTASTWTGTTITFAGHTGSGLYEGEWIVEV